MAWKPDYCTSQDLKDYVRISDAYDDAQVALAVTAASRAIDTATNRQFGQLEDVQERFYTPWWNKRKGCWEVEIDDVQDVTDLEIHMDNSRDNSFSTEITEGYVLLPRNASGDDVPYTDIRFIRASPVRDYEIRVTALFGWATVPEVVKEATLMQASRLLARRDAPFGVAGSPDQNSEMRILAKLDPDVVVTLKSVYRWWGAR